MEETVRDMTAYLTWSGLPQILDILKTVILKCYKEEEREKKSVLMTGTVSYYGGTVSCLSMFVICCL